MNSGAWSFLSVMVMVAVAVPVKPTSLPAMSLATISNSYVVVGSVWKINSDTELKKTKNVSRIDGIGNINLARVYLVQIHGS